MTAINQTTLIKAVLLLASSLTVLASAIIAPSLPEMSGHFTARSDVLIKLILTMPALFIALTGTLLGHLADRLGRKALLLGALLLYGIAGFSGYFIDNLTLLLLSRAALGIAVAGIMSTSTTLIGDYFPPDEQAKFLGLQGSFMAMGGIVFLNLGGMLAEWHWRGPFLVYLFSIVLLPIAMYALYEPARHAGHSSEEAQTNAPINRRLTALIYFISFMGMLLLYVVPTQLPFLLAEQAKVGSAAVGFAISSGPITTALFAFFYGRLKPYFSFATLYAIGFATLGIGYAIVGLSGSYAMAVAGVAINGIGLGLILPNGSVWLMRITPARARGRILGGYTSLLFLGQFLSPIAVAPLARALPSLGSVFEVMGGVALVLALALGAASRMSRRRGTA